MNQARNPPETSRRLNDAYSLVTALLIAPAIGVTSLHVLPSSPLMTLFCVALAVSVAVEIHDAVESTWESGQSQRP